MRATIVCLLLAAASVAAGEPLPLTDTEQARLDVFQNTMQDLRQDLADTEIQLKKIDGVLQEILNRRRDQILTELFVTTNNFARDIAALSEDGKDVGEHIADAALAIAEMPKIAFAQIDRITAASSFPIGDMDVAKRVVLDREFFAGIRRADAFYTAMAGIKIAADELGLPFGDADAMLDERLRMAAMYRSVFLSLAIDDLAHWRESASILGDDKEVVVRVRLAESRVSDTANALQTIVGLLSEQKADVRRYRQQLLAATGEITTDILDLNILGDIVSDTLDRVGLLAKENAVRVFFRILLVLAIVGAFFKLAGWLQSITTRVLKSSRMSVSSLLARMLTSAIRNLVIVLGVLIALSQLGISLGPLLAGLGIAGFIIGFAMQDTLSNFASGVLILVYRPFDVGDEVEAGGVSGRVSSMSLVNTSFLTQDNQSLVVPNNVIWQSVIRNITSQTERRIDMTIGVSYDADIEKVERVLSEILSTEQYVLPTPEFSVQLHEFAESSVNFVVRPWVRTENYRRAYWSIMRAIKIRFDEESISIPFPQRDLHFRGTQQFADGDATVPAQP